MELQNKLNRLFESKNFKKCNKGGGAFEECELNLSEEGLLRVLDTGKVFEVELHKEGNLVYFQDEHYSKEGMQKQLERMVNQGLLTWENMDL